MIPLPGGPTDIVAADFTGDGELDLAVTRVDLSDIVILANDGAGNFQPLFRDLKRRFDPGLVLNPGRFAGHI